MVRQATQTYSVNLNVDSDSNIRHLTQKSTKKERVEVTLHDLSKPIPEPDIGRLTRTIFITLGTKTWTNKPRDT